ncbi:unnamed protein product [Caenorhabditis nigoni]
MTLYNLIKKTEAFINCSPSKKKSMVEKHSRFHIWVKEEIDIFHENLDIATKNDKDMVIEFNVTIFDIWNRVLQRLSKNFEEDQRFVAHSVATKVALPLIFIMMHGVYGMQFIVYPDIDEMDIKANTFYEKTGKRFFEEKLLQVDRVMKYINDPEKKILIETKYQASKQKYEDEIYYFLLCRPWPRHVLKVENFHRRELPMPKQLVLYAAEDFDAEIDVVNVDEDNERLPIHIRMNPFAYNHDESDSDQSGYYDDYEEPNNVESDEVMEQIEDVNEDRQDTSAQQENADCFPRPTHDELLSSSQSSANRIPEPSENISTEMIPSLQNPDPQQLLYVHGPISQGEPRSEHSQSKYLEKDCKAVKDEQKQEMICHEKLAQRTLNEEALEALGTPEKLNKTPESPRGNTTLYESDGGENYPTENTSAESVDGGSEQRNEPVDSNSKPAYKESESSEKSTSETSSASKEANGSSEASKSQQQSTQSSGSGISNCAPEQTHETSKLSEQFRNNDFESMKNSSVKLVHKSSSLPNLSPKGRTDLKKGESITKNSSSSNSLESEAKQKGIGGTPPLNYDIGTPQSFHSTSSMGSNPASPEHLEAPPSIQTIQTPENRDSTPLSETKETEKPVESSLEKNNELDEQERIPSLELPSNSEESSSNISSNLRKRPRSPRDDSDIPPKI